MTPRKQAQAKSSPAQISSGAAASGAKSSAADAKSSVDEQLAKYRTMRDFATTAEPRGGAESSPKQSTPQSRLPFVVQKHAATRLHYDFRLGWRGVLKSWAVAKGPSYVVKDRRLAVQVEDHPMEYGGFEGTIPKGQYGGGTVMVWDEGTWEPVGDADEGLRTGRLKFILHGHKLRGHWTLIRMGGRAAEESKPNWLLIKEHDEFERSAEAAPVTEAEPDSVVTGRDLPAIAEAEDHVWDSRSGLAADERAKAKAPETRDRTPAPVRNDAPVKAPKSAPAEALPEFVEPQLASSADAPPAGADWVHELKLDGYRVQARVSHGRATLLTRKGLDWTHRMPELAATLAGLSPEAALLDGEVVALDKEGLSSFADLQAAFQEGRTGELIYYVFDLLHLNGSSLRELPLRERKGLLRELLEAFGATDHVRYSDHIAGRSEQMYQEACRLGAEGVVSKQLDSKYLSGRSASWLKAKCSRRQEFVICGFTLPTKGGDGLGAVLLGYYRGDSLVYAGRCGTGFTQKSQREVREKLEALRQKTMPFAKVEAAARRGALWVKPTLVAEVAFRTWTRDAIVRQASFKGLREDKPATEVRREEPLPVEQAEEEAAAEKATLPKRRETSKTAARGNAAPIPLVSATVKLSHPDKLLDESSGLRKQMLADYYATVAPWMLPYIAGRPLSIVRCPNGSTAKCFFQKHIKVGLPKSVGSILIQDKKGGPPEPYITLSTEEALVSLAQLNVLELHPWGSTNKNLECPDQLIFDLDPDVTIPWATLGKSALEVRSRLKSLGLESFLKSTGGKGLHILTPIEPEHDWVAIKAFAHAFVRTMEQGNSQLYLTKMTKAARAHRIYLDYLRNERGATAVAPYSPRSRAGVPVSVPLGWEELSSEQAPNFQVAQLDHWSGRLANNPWAGLNQARRSLSVDAIQSVESELKRR